MTLLHDDRDRALSFGADPARYDRARPSYPSELVDLLARGRRRVLDVGCGTGIASRLFTARGCEVLGLEPDARMVAFARLHGLAVEEAPFEAWEDAGRRFDLLVAGQAWHWVDPARGAAKAGVVVEPGGRVGLFWNVARHEPSIEAAFDAEYRRLGLQIDRHSVVLGRGTDDRFLRTADALRAAGVFDAVEQLEYGWSTQYTTQAWLDQLPTHSDHAALPATTLAALLDRVGAVVDGRGGAFSVAYRTVLVTAVRR